MNSVEKRNLKKILDEKDGLTKAAIRELPKNSKEENQKKLKQAVEILKKNDRSILKSLSNKSTKVQKIKKTKKPEHSLSNANTVSKRSLIKFDLPISFLIRMNETRLQIALPICLYFYFSLFRVLCPSSKYLHWLIVAIAKPKLEMLIYESKWMGAFFVLNVTKKTS